MITKSKVDKMGESIANFRHKIGELEAKLVPSTPPHSMEKRQTQVQGDVQAIKDVEAFCAKVYEEVSQASRDLVDDAKMHEIAVKLSLMEKSMENLRGSLKNPPPIECISKVSWLNILQ